jgi:predicted RNase H-like nuclease
MARKRWSRSHEPATRPHDNLAAQTADFGAACAAVLATSKPPRNVSNQLVMIAPKIKEVDAVLRSDRTTIEERPKHVRYHLFHDQLLLVLGNPAAETREMAR